MTHEEFYEQPVTVTLPYSVWTTLASAARQHRKKRERQIDPNFVPEQGKIDVNRVAIDKMRLASNRIETALKEVADANPRR
jgi:hypothetical protein